MIQMALVDPYAPCPCGSDKKFKWCCQKVESYIERAYRLSENGQQDAAMTALDDGLAKVPDSPWVLLRKAVLLLTQEEPEAAKQCAKRVLDHNPKHMGAAVLLTRVLLATEGPVAAASQLQHALLHCGAESRSRLVKVAALVGEGLAKQLHVPAALKHFELALALDDSEGSVVRTADRSLKGNPALSPWLKEPYRLTVVPDGPGGPARKQFESALDWAREGLWESAASAFELLTADREVGLTAERNLGLCRLWLGEDEAACATLRRWLDRTPPTTDAVDLAVLCQAIDHTPDPEPVEQIRLSWPLRDRNALSKTLDRDARVVQGEPRKLDPDDDQSPEVAVYHWLDRPKVEPRDGLARTEIPLIQADLLIGADVVMLEAYDDGRLNDLIDRFAALAGRAVPPAHPRSKVIGTASRGAHALSWHWYLPPELSEEEQQRLTREQIAHLTVEVWPMAPQSFLGGQTPRQAAQSGRREALLRGAILALEHGGDDDVALVDWASLRSRLGLLPETSIDPETVEIDRLAVGRLTMVPYARLDDDRLVALYHRAHEYGVTGLLPKLALEIVRREGLLASGKVEALLVYGDLAWSEVQKRDRDAALTWLRQGRAAQGAGRDGEAACQWDMMELEIRTQFDKLEDWVPELAVVLDRYRENERARLVLTTRLLEMGLLQLASPADRPGEILLDSRPLQQLLSLYGPKVTTASGYLGVSATKGEIWTPGSQSKGSTIWTPGSDVESSGGEQKSRIILTS
jgi:tetratricopeptide (TPR) repeat protein